MPHPNETDVINARQINLYDSKGTLRLHLDAGDGDGNASISIYGRQQQMIQISVHHDGGLSIELHGSNRKTQATIGITKENLSGLDLRGTNGELGTLLGANIFKVDPKEQEQHSLHLFENGQLLLHFP